MQQGTFISKGLVGSIKFFFIKNLFLALAHKSRFLKKTGWVFRNQFLKAENSV
jgi:hypothetical protein